MLHPVQGAGKEAGQQILLHAAGGSSHKHIQPHQVCVTIMLHMWSQFSYLCVPWTAAVLQDLQLCFHFCAMFRCAFVSQLLLLVLNLAWHLSLFWLSSMLDWDDRDAARAQLLSRTLHQAAPGASLWWLCSHAYRRCMRGLRVAIDTAAAWHLEHHVTTGVEVAVLLYDDLTLNVLRPPGQH